MHRTFPEALPDIASVAAVLGDPSRAAMCAALMNGLAWTATELTTYTGLGAPTVSKHLDKLIAAGVVDEVRQGRHRYLRLAGDEVAHVIESLGVIAQGPVPSTPSLRVSKRNDQVRAGRTCYKHLAGQFGVGLTEQLHRRGHLGPDWQLTDDGNTLLSSWGMRDASTHPAMPCMDSTERRFHLAGELGKRLCTLLFDNGWVHRIGTSRAVKLSPRGQQQLASAGLTPLMVPEQTANAG